MFNVFTILPLTLFLVHSLIYSFSKLCYELIVNQELVLAVREQSRHNRCCPSFHEAQSQEEYKPLNRHLQFSMVCVMIGKARVLWSI